MRLDELLNNHKYELNFQMSGNRNSGAHRRPKENTNGNPTALSKIIGFFEDHIANGNEEAVTIKKIMKEIDTCEDEIYRQLRFHPDLFDCKPPQSGRSKLWFLIPVELRSNVRVKGAFDATR